ncbi:MAG: hypothetical protein ACOCVH_02095 [Verrucomicrobiota bacterium]
MEKKQETLRKHVNKSALTKSEIAKRAGISKQRMNSFCNNDKPFSKAAYDRVRAVLVSIGEMQPQTITTQALLETAGLEIVGVSPNTVQAPSRGDIYAKHDSADVQEHPTILNGHDKPENPIPSSYLNPGWNAKNMVCLLVHGDLSERYRDGARVFVERDVPPADIPDGDDVIVWLSGTTGDRRHAIRRWRTDGKNIILVNLQDPQGIPITWSKRKNPVYGVVRLVLG